jgi:hypothetical protein
VRDLQLSKPPSEQCILAVGSLQRLEDPIRGARFLASMDLMRNPQPLRSLDSASAGAARDHQFDAGRDGTLLDLIVQILETSPAT